MKGLHGRVVNTIEYPRFAIGKELQMHVLELKSKKPFRSPRLFEENLSEAVAFTSEYLKSKYGASLLGSGMHPLLDLSETAIWPHRHTSIYRVFQSIFNMRQHGWLNIQAFQLNLPYGGRKRAATVHNVLANMIPYLPAISASSPICEGRFGDFVDNRMYFYKLIQKEVPSIAGDVIPEYIQSIEEYRKKIVGKYSADLAKAKASKSVLYKDWINARGITLRFDRRAVEIRIIDEQECIRSDVALSCFIRGAAKGLIDNYEQDAKLLPHESLVKDFNSVIREGRKAIVAHPKGPTARDVCNYLYGLASKHASDEDNEYLPLVKRRIEEGNLSEVIVRKVQQKSQKAETHEAIISTYLDLSKALQKNTPYF